jgi:hypothetical protein
MSPNGKIAPRQIPQRAGDLDQHAAIDRQCRDVAIRVHRQELGRPGRLAMERHRARFELGAGLVQRDVGRHRTRAGREPESQHGMIPMQWRGEVRADNDLALSAPAEKIAPPRSSIIVAFRVILTVALRLNRLIMPTRSWGNSHE